MAFACRRYKDAGLSDVAIVHRKEGLTWRDSAPRVQRRPEGLADWRGNRADAGRLPPMDFRNRTSSARHDLRFRVASHPVTSASDVPRDT